MLVLVEQASLKLNKHEKQQNVFAPPEYLHIVFVHFISVNCLLNLLFHIISEGTYRKPILNEDYTLTIHSSKMVITDPLMTNGYSHVLADVLIRLAMEKGNQKEVRN